MNYLSVCSGIEAASVAWNHLGWKPLGFSEIEKFPSEVLAHHYPKVPNLGDMTKYKDWSLNGTIGLLVGGTPCQSFSVAGLRKGLEDPRGNLALTYVGILDKFRPKWCVWENVPGVLSSGGGRDFGAFLGALGELGYGWSYRVLDAKNFGVAQRRRRVFVVGCLGNWESAAKVLFESESLSGNSKQSRTKRKSIAEDALQSIVGTLDTECGGGRKAHQSVMSGHFIPTFVESSFGQYREDVIAGTTKASGGVLGGGSETFLTVYENHPSDSRVKEMGETCQTVTSTWGMGGGNIPFVQSVDMYNLTTNKNTSQTIRNGTDIDHVGGLIQNMAVRRLTEVECERLQGFPDNYTNIKENCPSGVRYKALGNSMAVPVMKWIGTRIDKLEKGLL